MASSLRACLAAEGWKRLYPDENRGGKAKPKKLGFEDFAREKFKVNKAYAQQALAILNHSPELLEDAKSGLAMRIRARASRRCGELLKEVEKGHGKNQNNSAATDTKVTRQDAAEEAGMSQGVGGGNRARPAARPRWGVTGKTRRVLGGWGLARNQTPEKC